jgi:hypothetical protein
VAATPKEVGKGDAADRGTTGRAERDEGRRGGGRQLAAGGAGAARDGWAVTGVGEKG